ncbi:MAG: transposase domain-containing protein [Gemmatimonadaceae bacterium]
MRERRNAAPPKPQVPSGDRAARDTELWANYERKSDRVKGEATRRLTAVAGVEQLVREGCQRLEAYAIVAHQAEESESTIRNWCRLVKGEPEHVWAPLLMPKWVGRTKTAEYDSRIYDMFRDSYLHPSRPPASTCYHRVARWAKAEQLSMPSYATLCRALKRREDPAVILLEREGERALAASFPHLERTRDGLYAMELVNADGHMLDLDTVWPDGERCRTTLLAVQDVYSSAVPGWRLVKSESAHEMGLTFLKTFEDFGLPKRMFLDNTLAAASKRMTSGAKGRYRFRDREGDPIGVLPLLNVQVTFVTPGHGQAKPIERFFRSIADLVSKHPAFTGAYLGNNTQNKPANYGTRTITVAELEPILRHEIHVYNTTRDRRGRASNGLESYQEIFQRSYAEHAHEIARITLSQRRLLYMVAENVTVNRRDGAIVLFKNRYWSEAVSQLKATKVVVRYDPEDLHKSVWVYRQDGTLVGEAPIYSKAGFADAAAAERVTRARGQFKRNKKHLAEAKRRLSAAEVAAMIPPVDAPEIAAASGAAKRVDFALPTTPEQLGAVTARDRKAATKRATAAVSKVADAIDAFSAPRRKRA